MIKYKTKQSNHPDIVQCVLENRNLTMDDVNEILKPSIEEYNPFLMKNMDKAVESLREAIELDLNIGIVPDVDNDGYCSSAIVEDFIRKYLNKETTKIFHHKYAKSHGVDTEIYDKVIKNNIQCLIIPDAGSTLEDFSRIKSLSEKHNVKIIILDHHNVEYTNNIPNICLVNPHQEGCEYPNKALSGTAVTYKFIQAYCQQYEMNIENKYIDLVALSLISDMMDMTSLENRLLFNKGCLKSNITSPLMLEFIVSKRIPGDKITIEQCAFSIASQINATIRIGTSEDKELLSKAFYTRGFVPSNKRGNQGAMEDIQVETIRILNNNKQKQDKPIKAIMPKIVSKIEDNNLHEDKVIMVNVTDILDNSTTGLVANKLLSLYKKPIMMLRNKKENNKLLAGSCRGIGVKSFKDICSESKLFNGVSGHNNSFGYELKIENLDLLKKYFNETLKDVDFEEILEVDAAYNIEVPLDDIISISNLGDLWCKDIQEPKFIVKNVVLDTSAIMKIGNATYTFRVDNLSFTKNFGSTVFIEEFAKSEMKDKKAKYPFPSKHIICDIVCRFRKNEKGYAYIDIVDAKSKEIELTTNTI